MKKIILLIYLTLSSISLVYSQVDENKNFLYLFSDTVIYGRVVDYETPIFGRPYFLIDYKKINSRLVKFYGNETGFYANTITAPSSRRISFTERIRKGKINLYETERIIYSDNHNPMSSMYFGGVRSKTIQNYYNKGFGDLKISNYKNLSVDLSDNIESMYYLNKYKKTKNLQTTLNIIGGISIAASLASIFITPTGMDSNVPLFLRWNVLAFGIGGGCFTVSYFTGLTKPRYLKRAIDIYNK